MAKSTGPDFVDSFARGLDVIRVFSAVDPSPSLSRVAEVTGLSRPAARRMLRTLVDLGYARESGRGFTLTPKVLELGVAYVQSSGLWELARPHLEDLVAQTGESSSLAQLDGSDIVYVARVAVPKIIAIQVSIGTRFPARSTSLGKVLLADLGPDDLSTVLAHPTRSGVVARHAPDRDELDATLSHVRAQGWAVTDEQLASGIRSVAAPVRDGSGRVVAAMNVTVHAAETSLDVLHDHHLPLLLRAAGGLSADLARVELLPRRTVTRTS